MRHLGSQLIVLYHKYKLIGVLLVIDKFSVQNVDIPFHGRAGSLAS